MKAAIWLVALVASVVNVPSNLIPQDGSSLVTSKDQRSGWKTDWGMQEIRLQGKRAVRFTEQGTGRLSEYSQEVQWSVQSTWLAADAFLPLDSEKTIKTPEGKVLLVERKHFDHVKGTVRFERQRAGKRDETKSLEVPSDTLAIEGLAGVLRFATLDKSHTLSANVLTNEPKIYNVSFEWRGEERIKTPAGEFDCYKVEMVPHMGVLNLFRPFFPKTYFWFTTAAPHNWVRYQGPESGPGTPDVLMELSSRGH